MSWISVAVAAVCGALAALIATAAVRDREQHKSRHAVVFVVAMALLFGASRLFITPMLQARYEAYTLDQSLSSNAAFAAIKKHDPETYSRIMSELRAGLLSGHDKAELIEIARNNVAMLVQKRLPQASDEAATGYMRVMVQEMGELRRQGGDLCYRFLFAQPGQGLNLTRYVSTNTVEADASALSEVLRSSALAPQPVPQQAEVGPRMQPVVAALTGRYGQDVALLQQPLAPGVDRDKLCAISIDMYTLILQMPQAESGKLIRYLMGQG